MLKRRNFWKSMLVASYSFLEKSIPYATSGHVHKLKTIVHWASPYQVFIKKLIFIITNLTSTGFLWSQTQFVMKRHFFIWSHLRCVSKGFTIIIMITIITITITDHHSHILPQPFGRLLPPADWKSQLIGRLLPADWSRLSVEWPYIYYIYIYIYIII